jgi:hypothetical protein
MTHSLTVIDAADTVIQLMILSCPEQKEDIAKQQLSYLVDKYESIFRPEYEDMCSKSENKELLISFIHANQSIIVAYLQRMPGASLPLLRFIVNANLTVCEILSLEHVHALCDRLVAVWLKSLDMTGITEEGLMCLYELLESREWSHFRAYVPQVIQAFQRNIGQASLTDCEETARLLADLAKEFGGEKAKEGGGENPVKIDWLIPVLLGKLDVRLILTTLQIPCVSVF